MHYSRPTHQVRKGVADSQMEENMPPKVYRRLRQKDKVAPVGIDGATQAMLDYIGDKLDVRYNVIGNDGGRFHVDVVLSNTGDRMIPPCCWSIYLYHMKYGLVLHKLFILDKLFTVKISFFGNISSSSKTGQ